MNKRFGYGKLNRLKSRKKIDQLFKKGKSFTIFPIRVIYDFILFENHHLQTGVTVNKRHFKKAVERNRIKRLMKEGIRVQKLELESILKNKDKCCDIFFIYIDKTILPYSTINKSIHDCFERIKKLEALHESAS